MAVTTVWAVLCDIREHELCLTLWDCWQCSCCNPQQSRRIRECVYLPQTHELKIVQNVLDLYMKFTGLAAILSTCTCSHLCIVGCLVPLEVMCLIPYVVWGTAGSLLALLVARFLATKHCA